MIHHINNIKDGNQMIILIHAENTFDKIPHQFQIKTLNKVDIEGMNLNIIKTMANPQS